MPCKVRRPVSEQDFAALRREWIRLQSVEAKVIAIGRSRGQWRATIATSLGRRATCYAPSPARALIRCREELGYYIVGRGRLAYAR